MRILSHRGFWLSADEKNSRAAFKRSQACGFGVETDLRDQARRLVIAHDPAGDEAMGFGNVLQIFAGTGLPLAINIKADGLAPALQAAMQGQTMDWFAFDMSGPEMVRYLALGLPVFTRHSDIEPAPLCYDQAAGVWLDAFHHDWFTAQDIVAHLDRGKSVAVVSPELHGRDRGPVWDWIAASGLCTHPRLLLCTDHPQEAAACFLGAVRP